MLTRHGVCGKIKTENLYAYCDNNPVMRVDRDGQMWDLLDLDDGGDIDVWDKGNYFGASYLCKRRRNKWNSDYAMNKLNIMKNMGFRISWKLINIGLFGYDEIPVVLTRGDVLEYLYSSLNESNEQTDDIIKLICEEDNYTKFDNIIKEFANKDDTLPSIQKRKWRAYLLKSIIDNLTNDYTQDLLELMEFWESMGHPGDCPHPYPTDEKSMYYYFTKEMYEFGVNKNKEWLNQEIIIIINLES